MTTSDVTTASGSRLERKRARNRDALVRAARRLFVKDGFDATTIADISEAADLGFGTFYRYFPDKEAVLAAVLDEGKQAIDNVIAAAAADEGAPADALRHFSAGFVQAVCRNRDLFALFWQVSMPGRSGRRPLRFERAPGDPGFPATLMQAIERLVVRGIASGDFARCDAQLVAGLLTGAHMHLLFAPATQRLDEAAMIDTLCAFELRALGADSIPMAVAAGRTGR